MRKECDMWLKCGNISEECNLLKQNWDNDRIRSLILQSPTPPICRKEGCLDYSKRQQLRPL